MPNHAGDLEASAPKYLPKTNIEALNPHVRIRLDKMKQVFQTSGVCADAGIAGYS